jgi:hypothetical protein
MKDVREVLESIGYTSLVDYGKQFSTRPLYRNSDNNTALTINKETGEWFDFVEKIGGPLEMLIERTMGITLSPDFQQRLNTITGIAQRKTEIELVHIKSFNKKLLLKLNKDHAYWEKRGISKNTIEKFNGGVSTNGRMMNRYVFPIFSERNELIGFTGRYIWKLHSNTPKWKHIGPKTTWIFPLINAQNILKKKEVILVESIGDMLSLYDKGVQNVLVTFGIKISPKLIEFLLKLDVHKIYIAFNNDKDNNLVGNKAANDAKIDLSSYFDPNQIQISLPATKNDFGEMNFEEILLWKTENQME